MTRYYDAYDVHGEPISVLLPPVLSYPAGEPMPLEACPRQRFEREAEACIDADALYDTLRHEGYSHAEARAIIAERFKI